MAYQASITAFTHVHYVNGVLITHSHPFHNQHSHSTDSLIVIGLLSHFSCLVFDVPIFGTRRTNVWYPSYLPLVLAVPSTGTEIGIIK